MGDFIKEYKARLDKFNSSQKYFDELGILRQLLNVRFGETILDYGCGTGKAIRFLQEHTQGFYLGFDIINYNEGEENHYHPASRNSNRWYVNYVPIEVKKVYFMHSFAHIENINEVLINLRARAVERIVVITPNMDWINCINKIKNDKYIPDPTVYRHYDAHSLSKIIENAGYAVQIGEIGALCEGHKERLVAVATLIE